MGSFVLALAGASSRGCAPARWWAAATSTARWLLGRQQADVPGPPVPPRYHSSATGRGPLRASGGARAGDNLERPRQFESSPRRRDSILGRAAHARAATGRAAGRRVELASPTAPATGRTSSRAQVVWVWLAAELGFPGWTAATVNALPEVRIGDWARTHGIAIDASLASEEKRGRHARSPSVTTCPLSARGPERLLAGEWGQAQSTLAFSAWTAAAAAGDRAAAPAK